MTASALIAINRNRILLMQRDDYDWLRNPGKWALPGGQVEEGETYEEALEREIKEELSISIKNYRYFGTVYIEARLLGKIYITNLSDRAIKMIRLGEEGIGYGLFTSKELVNLEMTDEIKYFRKLFYDNAELLLTSPDDIKPEEVGLRYEQ